MAWLLAPDHAPFMYSVHKILCAFQCAESLAKKRFETRERDKSTYRARKRSIEEAIADGETVTWVKRKIERNDKLLRDPITELVQSTGAVGSSFRRSSRLRRRRHLRPRPRQHGARRVAGGGC